MKWVSDKYSCFGELKMCFLILFFFFLSTLLCLPKLHLFDQNTVKDLKGSYDAILKIIIVCSWCTRICWHDLMFKNIIFQILYIIVGSLWPASQTLCFLQSPSFWQAQSALIGQLTQCNALWLADTTSHVGNVTPLSIITSFSFQFESKDSK